ncbi:MAG TPA: GNAT family N-acetyltransferase [Novosphingobium sp.]|nr:GNAT family N-acetyltransferase [Novosphingobium sp.]
MIETERLILREPVADDLAWTLDEMNTPMVMRHLGGVCAPDAVAEGFARNVATFARTGIGFWTVVLREGGANAGKCGVSAVESDHAPEVLRGHLQIGWSLAERHWGRGIAEEAARAVLRHLFAALGHDVVYSQTSDSNRASTQLMARIGFTRLRDLDYLDPDYPAEDNPTTVYRLDRADWAV